MDHEDLLLQLAEAHQGRERAERRLRAFTRAFAKARLGIALLGPDAELEYANPAAARLLATMPLFRDEVEREVALQVVRDHGSWSAELHGQGTPPRAYTAHLYGADSRARQLLLTLTDVTLQRRLSDAARAERDRAREYLDVAGSLMVVLDQEARVRRLNRAACELLGVTENEAYGQDWLELAIPPRLRPAILEMLASLRDGGEHDTAENPVVTVAGEERLIQWTHRVLHHPSGAFAGVLSSGVDVTDERRRTAALLSHQQALTQLHDISLRLAAGGRTGDLLQWAVHQGAALVAADYATLTLVEDGSFTRAFTVGLPPGTRWLSDDAPLSAEILTGQPIQREQCKCSLAQDDHLRVGPVLGAPVQYGGQVHAAMLLARRRGSPMFTDQERALVHTLTSLTAVSLQTTRTLRELDAARRDAESASRAKSDFLATMSHEIRTPLNGVLGMAEALAATELTPAQRDTLGVIRSSGEALLAILNDILDLSRVEAGHMELEFLSADLRDIVEDTLGLLGARAEAKGLELTWLVEADVPERVLVDPTRMRQILLNLVSNAIKFTEQGSVRVRVRHEGEQVQIAVEDTGIGIPPDRLDTVFQAFTQADASTTRRFGGTGLGLSISARLADLMGGDLHAHSEVGRGSQFHLRIPTPTADGGHPPQSELAGEDVLIVEGAATTRANLEVLLTRWGARAASASSGAAALQAIVDGFDPSLLLIDPNLPSMADRQVLRAIRAMTRRDLPAVLLAWSACTQVEPSDAVVRRPVRRAELLTALREARGDEITVLPGPDQVRLTGEARVLLVEDNAVNRRVARAFLSRHPNLEILEAEDGLAALEILEREPVELVLMDVQMPRMDGYEATRRLRAQPRWADLPVVAMTAHAYAEARQACDAAGMSDFLSKPVRAADLERVLTTWIPSMAGTREQLPRPPEAPDAPAIVDLSELRESFEDDEDLVHELVELVLLETPRLLADLTSAIEARDHTTGRRLAHSLKGSMANFGAAGAIEVARTLEYACRDHQQERYDELLEHARAAWGAVEAALRG